jgi:hypothetical protein
VVRQEQVVEAARACSGDHGLEACRWRSLPLADFLERVLRTIAGFSPYSHGVDHLVVSIHGESHSETNPKLRSTTRASYRKWRSMFAGTARRWDGTGSFESGADPNGVAELLTSICLGVVAHGHWPGAPT